MHLRFRNTRLIQEGCKRSCIFGFRYASKFSQEIVSSSIAEHMRLQVVMHNALKVGWPDRILKHRQDRTTLLISNPVECIADVTLTLDGLVDTPRTCLCI